MVCLLVERLSRMVRSSKYAALFLKIVKVLSYLLQQAIQRELTPLVYTHLILQIAHRKLNAIDISKASSVSYYPAAGTT